MMKAIQWFKTLLSQAGGWLIPHFCVLCGTAVEGLPGADIPLCDRCLGRLPEIRGDRCSACGKELFSEKGTCYACREPGHACSEVYPIFRYRAEPAALLRRYKSAKRASLAKFWADRMAPVIEQRWPDRVIVPVPPRLEKLRRHEWDQVEAIAACLEKMGYGVERILFRSATAQQKHLSRIARKSNAEKGYFIIPKFTARAPARVVLIDDVYTTGATVDSCARALLENGSEKVAALVIAAD
jgi:competence protein ComFC